MLTLISNDKKVTVVLIIFFQNFALIFFCLKGYRNYEPHPTVNNGCKNSSFRCYSIFEGSYNYFHQDKNINKAL